MASVTTSDLVIAATVFGGILAGGNVDRVVVQMPAWRHMGARSWAAYSRHADLGNGLFLYPFVALSGALLTIAAAIAFHFDATAPRSAAMPVYLAAALVAGGLLATIGAAPKMLSLRRIGDDPAALQKAFDGFELWGGVRAVFQVLAFGANLWSLVLLLSKALAS
ncbi:MAG TPA: hypothetical protein VGL03_00355 [Thermoanaerobaculia bacterium]|jgi:hypothetical protein